ncbi:twin-arginine translocation signal domain-containing protein, partial [Pseudomonas sichuanensis]
MSQDQNDKTRRQFLATSTVLCAAGAIWSALPFTGAAGSAQASIQGGSMTAD